MENRIQPFEIICTDIKQTSSRKHFPLIDVSAVKGQETFVESLLQKKYQLNKKVPQYTYGKVYLENQQNEKMVFRIFKDNEMGISSKFQKKINQTTVDDDVKTTSSQIAHALRQNKKDVLTRIYEEEKWPNEKKPTIEQMEDSLFDQDKEERLFMSQQEQSQKKVKYLSQ